MAEKHPALAKPLLLVLLLVLAIFRHRRRHIDLLILFLPHSRISFVESSFPPPPVTKSVDSKLLIFTG
jgi:MYXO-CTERM domain-containing protein